eukprot:scaffold70781_cov73-Phaeocystis_antarctica.AAC.1
MPSGRLVNTRRLQPRVERVVPDAGEAVRQASQRDGFAADVKEAVGQAGQHKGLAAAEGAAADAGEACRE